MNHNTAEKQANLSDDLETIARQAEAEASQETAQEGQLLNQAQETEEKEKFQKAIEKAAVVIGGLSMGIEYLWPYVTTTQNEQFFDKGIYKTAKVLVKYNIPDKPEWLKKWEEEIDLARFLGLTALETYKQIQAHKEQEAKEKADQEAAQHGKKSESLQS